MPKLVLAYAYDDADGRNHKPDATVDVDDAEAARLLYYGLAREPDDGTPKAPVRRRAAKKTAAKKSAPADDTKKEG